ncbi:class I SAM-dependent methyltransferase [Salegentibacter sp. Hel_I_6]|uniref:class I SAM-dependent methyltransferase n=1 Tax=Salegentibacter sp. Hel_I_6 TaxID=1250278 RepID=UPI00055D3C09|nr:class I SAM-dependent methyltransferase [Salegentibacter sp. Hel_I_6]
MNLLKKLKASVTTDKKLQIIRSWERFESRFYRNDLDRLAKIFKTDKNGIHYYTQHYQFHLKPLRKKRLNLLEIGVGGYKDPKSGGHSLRMWKAYFPKANIYAVDIYDKKFLEESRIKIFKGSQVDFDFMKNVSLKISELDIIVDDGSHINSHVIDTFKFMFPLLKQNGIYFIEDTQTSYWQKMGGTSEEFNSFNSIMGYFKSLTDGLNYQEFDKPGYKPNYFELNITSIHFYHNLIVIYKGLNNEPSNFMVNNQKPQ